MLGRARPDDFSGLTIWPEGQMFPTPDITEIEGTSQCRKKISTEKSKMVIRDDQLTQNFHKL